MKKLILMLLVLAGGVLNVSADDTTRRIWVQAGGSNYIDQISTKGNLCLYMWYNDGSDHKVLGAYNDNDGAMTRLANTAFFYVDVTMPEAITNANFIVRTVNDHNWKSGDITNVDVTGQTYFVWNEGNSCTSNAFTYKLYSTNTNQDFTYSDGVYTTTLNQASSSDSWYLIVPSFALSFDDTNKWNSMYRPSSNDEIGFENRINQSCSIAGGTNNIQPSANSYYDITFKPNGYYSFTPYITASLNASGYGTFGCSFADFKIPSTDTEDKAVSAYYAESISSSIITMTKKTGDVNKADGLFLIGTPSKTLKFTPATTTPAAVSSKLLPGDGTAKTPDASNFYYVLSGNSFKKLTKSTTIPEGKAYLHSTEALANEFTLSFDDGTTAIRVINTDATAIENSDIYNVAGQRVVNPTKGLYIMNGKKVIK